VRPRLRAGSDRGTTLTEVLVGMGIMTVFMSIFTGVVVNMYSTAGHTEAITTTSGQLSNAFVKLDKLVRYSSAISTPSGTVNAAGDYYVELQSSNTGSTLCTQLQLDTVNNNLNQRTWSVPSANTVTGLTSFTPLAANVTASAAPFVMRAAGLSSFEQLTVNLASTSGTTPTTSTSSITFTAVNSGDSSTKVQADATLSDSVCQEAGRP
jgi:hypothetical protein